MRDEPFKPQAYQLASDAVGALGSEVRTTWKTGGIKALKELPGIGQSIALKIDEYFRTGKIKAYESLKRKFPVDIWGLSRIEGLGPKRIRILWERLKIKNVKDLERALRSHRVRALPGFGIKSEERMQQGLGLMERESGRHLLSVVLPVAEVIVARLSRVPGVKRCVYAGSLRRRQETIGDIDLLATASHPERVMKAFVHLPEVEAVHEQGRTRASVRLKMGIDADLRVVPDEVFGAALQYFTGNKRHNIILRELAIRQGYKLNEYGLFKGTRRVAGKTEDEIYKKLGLVTPPPEARVGENEIVKRVDKR